MSSVTDIIQEVAQKLGVDPILALATSYVESGWNASAVGDNDSSFGLFQLHRGGELGSNTQAWADNPTNNATTALTVVANVAKQHPTWSPGQIAAAAQRPADQSAYAAKVNQIYNEIKSGRLKVAGAPGAPTASLAVDTSASPITNVWDWIVKQITTTSANDTAPGSQKSFADANNVTSAIGDIFGRAISILELPHLGMRILSGSFGSVLLIIGIYLFATEGSSEGAT